MACSTRSSERKRCSIIEPERRLRSLACTNPRKFPGVRWFTLNTEYNSPSCLITLPGRICVAAIIATPNLWNQVEGPQNRGSGTKPKQKLLYETEERLVKYSCCVQR